MIYAGKLIECLAYMMKLPAENLFKSGIDGTLLNYNQTLLQCFPSLDVLSKNRYTFELPKRLDVTDSFFCVDENMT